MNYVVILGRPRPADYIVLMTWACIHTICHQHQTNRLFTGAKCWKESEDAEDGGPGAYHHDGHMAGLLLTRTHLELTQGG